LAQQKAKAIMTSHFGRPKDEKTKKHSFALVAKILAELLKQLVLFCLIVSAKKLSIQSIN
jgi:3-phosphoglycerate kinase